jgi:DNA-directed RNA polymerase specialized sigma24 family protein
MVANEFVSARRKSARILPRAAVPDRRVAPDPAAGVDDRDELLQLIARLPRKQRAIVAMRHYADLPDDQIAAALHCTQSTVRSNAARALATLRREIGAGPETTSSQEHSR